MQSRAVQKGSAVYSKLRPCSVRQQQCDVVQHVYGAMRIWQQFGEFEATSLYICHEVPDISFLAESGNDTDIECGDQVHICGVTWCKCTCAVGLAVVCQRPAMLLL